MSQADTNGFNAASDSAAWLSKRAPFPAQLGQTKASAVHQQVDFGIIADGTSFVTLPQILHSQWTHVPLDIEVSDVLMIDLDGDSADEVLLKSPDAWYQFYPLDGTLALLDQLSPHCEYSSTDRQLILWNESTIQVFTQGESHSVALGVQNVTALHCGLPLNGVLQYLTDDGLLHFYNLTQHVETESHQILDASANRTESGFAVDWTGSFMSAWENYDNQSCSVFVLNATTLEPLNSVFRTHESVEMTGFMRDHIDENGSTVIGLLLHTVVDSSDEVPESKLTVLDALGRTSTNLRYLRINDGMICPAVIADLDANGVDEVVYTSYHSIAGSMYSDASSHSEIGVLTERSTWIGWHEGGPFTWEWDWAYDLEEPWETIGVEGIDSPVVLDLDRNSVPELYFTNRKMGLLMTDPSLSDLQLRYDYVTRSIPLSTPGRFDSQLTCRPAGLHQPEGRHSIDSVRLGRGISGIGTEHGDLLLTLNLIHEQDIFVQEESHVEYYLEYVAVGKCGMHWRQNGGSPSDDMRVPDFDADLLEDSLEEEQGTDRFDADTDGDGLPDGFEFLFGLNQGGDDTLGDLDGDGLTNIVEFHINTRPDLPDTDLDFLSDFSELNVTETNPLSPDTDLDGLSDGEEVLTWGTDPLSVDTDGDILSDGDEVFEIGTNPLMKDTDDDTLSDSQEHFLYLTDPTIADTDGDGLDDGTETQETGTDPLLADTDEDGLSDGDEISIHGTSPLMDDSDSDGFSDGDEVRWHTNPRLSQDNNLNRIMLGLGILAILLLRFLAKSGSVHGVLEHVTPATSQGNALKAKKTGRLTSTKLQSIEQQSTRTSNRLTASSARRTSSRVIAAPGRAWNQIRLIALLAWSAKRHLLVSVFGVAIAAMIVSQGIQAADAVQQEAFESFIHQNTDRQLEIEFNGIEIAEEGIDIDANDAVIHTQVKETFGDNPARVVWQSHDSYAGRRILNGQFVDWLAPTFPGMVMMPVIGMDATINAFSEVVEPGGRLPQAESEVLMVVSRAEASRADYEAGMTTSIHYATSLNPPDWLVASSSTNITMVGIVYYDNLPVVKAGRTVLDTHMFFSSGGGFSGAAALTPLEFAERISMSIPDCSGHMSFYSHVFFDLRQLDAFDITDDINRLVASTNAVRLGLKEIAPTGTSIRTSLPLYNVLSAFEEEYANLEFDFLSFAIPGLFAAVMLAVYASHLQTEGRRKWFFRLKIRGISRGQLVSLLVFESVFYGFLGSLIGANFATVLANLLSKSNGLFSFEGQGYTVAFRSSSLLLAIPVSICLMLLVNLGSFVKLSSIKDVGLDGEVGEMNSGDLTDSSAQQGGGSFWRWTMLDVIALVIGVAFWIYLMHVRRVESEGTTKDIAVLLGVPSPILIITGMFLMFIRFSGLLMNASAAWLWRLGRTAASMSIAGMMSRKRFSDTSVLLVAFTSALLLSSIWLTSSVDDFGTDACAYETGADGTIYNIFGRTDLLTAGLEANEYVEAVSIIKDSSMFYHRSGFSYITKVLGVNTSNYLSIARMKDYFADDGIDDLVSRLQENGTALVWSYNEGYLSTDTMRIRTNSFVGSHEEQVAYDFNVTGFFHYWPGLVKESMKDEIRPQLAVVVSLETFDLMSEELHLTITDTRTNVVFRIKEGADLEKLQTQIGVMLGYEVEIASRVTLFDGSSLRKQLFFMGINITFLIGVVVAFSALLLRASLEASARKHQLGILRALGFSRLQIVRVLTWDSVFIAILGVTLGLASAFVMTNMTMLLLFIGSRELQLDLSFAFEKSALACMAMVGASILGAILPSLLHVKKTVSEQMAA